MQTKFSGTGNAHTQTSAAADEWRELNARWFEFATFIPLLRVHGELQPREMWNLGGGDDGPVYQAEVKFDKLRYALLPYIYSLAGAVTQDGSTIMRPLVMDFASDATARELVDQYMFGPAFMVAPVTTYKARTRSVYLPGSATWYDFWTGAEAPGGSSFDAPAPYDQIPLFIRAGSIVPTGPAIQYTGEKPADPITLWVYAGADGTFSLYEDEGTNYNYEKGDFSRIPITWNDAKNTLEIGPRQGSFTGMLAHRTFNVVVVNKGHAQAFGLTPPAGKTVSYDGTAVSVTMP
jgi:alpha-D-xyloside xylohydrolase